ncbi:peptidoglycan-binding domain-containing protein [Calothrix sp. 336/3]|uniref:peptidoglycan-binding domain-containing protein n=1 Tax=Calothrix sp. 336/3 TaxID=1337936 RepID=UPI001EE0241B|nr:peptidoglycan-binding domain-containing protein [Calothrix sp. 336/3]
MSDLSILMTGMLVAGQISPPKMAQAVVIQSDNQVEQSTQGQTSQVVITTEITPPEFVPIKENLENATTPVSKQEIFISGMELGTVNNISPSWDYEFYPQPEFMGNSPILQSAMNLLTNSRNKDVDKTLIHENSPRPGKPDKSLSRRSRRLINNKMARLNSSLPLLRFGHSGDSVRVLQKLLSSNGYALPVDGSFDALTEAAVKAFQDQRNLVVDGIVGRNTWRELTL